MIVIGKIISTYQQGDEEEKDDELDFDDVEIGTNTKGGGNGNSERKTFCEVQVEQLVAFSDLQFTIYSHIY